MFVPNLIIAGGQRGADFGGLKGAKALGLDTGGYAPHGWRTESGPMPELGTQYGLLEHTSDQYAPRTYANMELCDAVIIVAGKFDSPGTVLTLDIALRQMIPMFKVPYPRLPTLEDAFLVENLHHWLAQIQPAILNIAGNRETKAPGIEKWTESLMLRLFT